MQDARVKQANYRISQEKRERPKKISPRVSSQWHSSKDKLNKTRFHLEIWADYNVSIVHIILTKITCTMALYTLTTASTKGAANPTNYNQTRTTHPNSRSSSSSQQEVFNHKNQWDSKAPAMQPHPVNHRHKPVHIALTTSTWKSLLLRFANPWNKLAREKIPQRRAELKAKKLFLTHQIELQLSMRLIKALSPSN